jgi:hypothetical protein
MEIEDKIIDAIKSGKINCDNISFDSIRRIAINPTPPDVHNELNYGQAILDSQDQLNKYFYAYGSMIKEQCIPLFNDLKFASTNVELIDYACGQGLASMLFFDKHKNSKKVTSGIILIEPSKMALERSKYILQCYAPDANIKTINKTLDDITNADLQTSNDATKIHLFSNILDMDEFSIPELFKKITTNKGENHFLAMSPDRSNYGGSARMDEFHNCFKDSNNLYAIKEVKTDSFTATNPSNYPGSKDFNVRYVYVEVSI